MVFALSNKMFMTDIGWLMELAVMKDEKSRLYQVVPEVKRGLSHESEAEL
jgi:hypothetical protein